MLKHYELLYDGQHYMVVRDGKVLYRGGRNKMRRIMARLESEEKSATVKQHLKGGFRAWILNNRETIAAHNKAIRESFKIQRRSIEHGIEDEHIVVNRAGRLKREPLTLEFDNPNVAAWKRILA